MTNEDIIQFKKYKLRPSLYCKYKLKRQYKCVLKQPDVTARAADDADEGRGRKRRHGLTFDRSKCKRKKPKPHKYIEHIQNFRLLSRKASLCSVSRVRLKWLSAWDFVL